MVICTKCKVGKPPGEYYRNRSRPNGLQNQCKACMSNSLRAEGNPHRQRQIRANNLMKDFGITIEQYDRMLETQDGKCAICCTDAGDAGRRLAVDHDHKTGQIRGLLCGRCNRALGLLDDDVQRLHKCVSYLRRTK